MLTLRRGLCCAMSVGNPSKELVSCVILDLDGTLLNTGRNFITILIIILLLNWASEI